MTPQTQRTTGAANYTPYSDRSGDGSFAVPRWLIVVGAIGGFVVTLLTVLTAAKHSADNTYVRADSFAVQRARQDAQHQRDSLILDSRLTRIEDHVGRADSNSSEALRILRRRP